MGFGWGDLIKPVTDLASKVLPDRAANDAAKAEAAKRKDEIDAALHQQQLDGIKASDNYESAWNLAMANASATSWKDEFWTIVLAMPLIGAFIPPLVPYIKAGFQAVSEMPQFYQMWVSAAISAAFGLQQVNKFWKWWQKP